MKRPSTAPIGDGIARRGRAEPQMAIIIRDKPSTYDWGWFSREDPRMHLQTVDKDHRHLHYKIWLEKAGRRVLEPEPGIPAKVLKVVQAEILQQRDRIEAYWASFMIKNDWLKVELAGTAITLYAYPNLPNHFERTIDLHELVANAAVASKLAPSDVALNEEFGCLELFPQRDEGSRLHEPLEKILWQR
jgi:hypothetical protein